jgi:hypothetical protein
MGASTESEWVARCLEELGHEVVVADPNFAPMDGTKTRHVKTESARVSRRVLTVSQATASPSRRNQRRPGS